jgi:hypothetical protein
VEVKLVLFVSDSELFLGIAVVAIDSVLSVVEAT